jgi:hypothetical protein
MDGNQCDFSIQQHLSPAKIIGVFLKTVHLLKIQQVNMTRQHPTLPGGGRFRVDKAVLINPIDYLDSFQ